jgi:hypothetical protein
MSTVLDRTDRQTATIPVVALGVTWDVSIDLCVEPECVTITCVDVHKGGERVNYAICEDAQVDIDASVVSAMRASYRRRVVLVAGVDA